LHKRADKLNKKAYRRAEKHRQALMEATAALIDQAPDSLTGGRKPKKRGKKRYVLLVLMVGGGLAAAANAKRSSVTPPPETTP
jgi:ferric-dicitrate binding protein FerR (iron transport regulator)